jgi:hypothetical protein
MMTLTAEQLDKFSREELLELLKQLLPLVAEVGRLKRRVSALEAENERLKNQSANSRDSSQPPSHGQKVSLPPKKNARNTDRLSAIRNSRARSWTIRIA